MKKLLLSAALGAMILTTTGCCNGPIRNLIRNTFCDDCQTPAAPLFSGFQSTPTGDCATGNCAGTVNPNTSYMNPGTNYNDPYLNGSNAGGATISAPVFDSFGGGNIGNTIVPRGSSGTLPGPTGQ